MPFAIYVLAEEIHASGVIAIVIAAVKETSSRASFTAEDRLSGHSFWEIVELLSVLTFAMVIPGLLLPWLVRQLNLDAGPDAGGDRVAAELNERAYQAARRTVQEHGPKLAPESYFMVQEWFDALAERRHVGPEGSRERREAFERACAAAIEVQNMALASATAELEQARGERRYNPRTSTPSSPNSTPWCSPPSAMHSHRRGGLARAFRLATLASPQIPKRQPNPFQNAKQMAFKTASRWLSKCQSRSSTC